MITVTTASPGAMIALKRPIVTGPRESTHQAMRMATRPPIVTTGPYWPRSVPAKVAATWLVARPAMTASSDDQPISVTRMTVKTMMPTPTTPKAPRSSVYCSEPQRCEATTEASTMKQRPMALPMSIAAMPASKPTSSAVEPPTRNAQVAIARAVLTHVKSSALQKRSFFSSGKVPKTCSLASFGSTTASLRALTGPRPGGR